MGIKLGELLRSDQLSISVGLELLAKSETKRFPVPVVTTRRSVEMTLEIDDGRSQRGGGPPLSGLEILPLQPCRLRRFGVAQPAGSQQLSFNNAVWRIEPSCDEPNGTAHASALPESESPDERSYQQSP
jgi:hypothetical protein